MPNLIGPESSHGWVIPRPDGRKAPCGGPMVCPACQLEQKVYTTTDRVVVMEGLVVKPGGKILLLASPNMSRDNIQMTIDKLKRDFPDTHFTIVQGFTGFQVSTEG